MTLESRLNELIEKMEHWKKTKKLQNNYYVVLTEMKNLRAGRPVGS